MARREAIPAAPGAVYSSAVRHGDLVYTSGMVGRRADGSFAPSLEEQAKATLEHLEAALKAAGTSMDRVIKVLVFLSSITDRPAFNEVYKIYFPHEPPARSCVEAGLGEGVLVEMECIAALQEDEAD